MILPWQQAVWQNLVQAHEQGRLAHGLLLHGPAGTGKLEFALHFARYLLCENPTSSAACGQCKSCVLSSDNSVSSANPDLHIVEPEELGKAIKVDQVRQLITDLSLTRHSTGHRVIIISPADALNVNASNSLLKTLEEPPEKTILVLVTNQLSSLLPTIRSRTQLVRFNQPAEENALEWLKQWNIEQAALYLNLAGGAPLAAKMLAESGALEIRQKTFADWCDLSQGKADAIEIAAKWSKQSLNTGDILPINWVYGWILDMISLLQGANPDKLINIDIANVLQKLAIQVDLISLFKLVDRVNESIIMTGSAANQQMLLEGILLNWSGLKRN